MSYKHNVHCMPRLEVAYRLGTSIHHLFLPPLLNISLKIIYNKANNRKNSANVKRIVAFQENQQDLSNISQGKLKENVRKLIHSKSRRVMPAAPFSTAIISAPELRKATPFREHNFP